MAGAVRVNGLRELQAALSKASKESRVGVRSALRDVAEPVRRDAEVLALSEVTRMTEPWSEMRTGVTRTSVYVAPKKRGVKGRGAAGSRRPKFGTLLMERAMQPALDKHQAETERRLEDALDKVADHFNRG